MMLQLSVDREGVSTAPGWNIVETKKSQKRAAFLHLVLTHSLYICASVIKRSRNIFAQAKLNLADVGQFRQVILNFISNHYLLYVLNYTTI